MNLPKHPWYKHRGYPHFDSFVSLEKAEAECKNKKLVSKNSFYPFIKFDKKVPRYDRKAHKVNPKHRQIAYAGHRDSHIYSYYSYILSIAYENFLLKAPYAQCILAYRKLGKSNVDFAFEAFSAIDAKAPCVVLGFDIEKYFDRIDHSFLKKRWAQVLKVSKLPADHFAVYKSITKFSSVDRNKLYKSLGIGRRAAEKLRRICTAKEFRDLIRDGGLVEVNGEKFGIPQGSPISALLSNIYLGEFDRLMHGLLDAMGGIYRRYCDDILVVCPFEKELEVRNEIVRLINLEKLTINSSKVARSEFRRYNGKLVATKPFQYLGFEFDGQRILIRSVTLSRYWRRLKNACRMAKKSAAGAGAVGGNARVFRRKLYDRFTHLGSRNFISYGFSAAMKMGSREIRRQLRRHWAILQEELKKPI